MATMNAMSADRAWSPTAGIVVGASIGVLAVATGALATSSS